MSSVAPLPPLDPEDDAMVRALADELHALPIASRGACLLIARDMFDAGCMSLKCLGFVESIQELQAELGTLKNVPLSNLQLRKLVQWAQQQRQQTVENSDIGSKRPHPASFFPHDSSQPQRPPGKEAPTLTFASSATIAIQQTPCSSAAANGCLDEAAVVVGALARACIASDAAIDLAQSLEKASLEFHHDSELAEAERSNMEQEQVQEEAREEAMEEDKEEEEEHEEKEEYVKQGDERQQQAVLTDDPRVLVNASSATASSIVEEDVALQGTADHHNNCGDEFQKFNSDDFGLHQLKKISKMSDWELCSDYWGRDGGLCSMSRTLADRGEGDVKEGDAVFVLQLDWGDDSVGPLTNRLEAKVVELGRDRRAGLVRVKYCKGNNSADGPSLWLHSRSFRIQRKSQEREREVACMNRIFDRGKSLKKIDAVHLKNSRLCGQGHSAFEFEALRLISKSDQPKDSQAEDLFSGSLEELGADDDFEKKAIEFKLKHKHHISALHSGSECAVHFKFDCVLPFIVFRPHPCALASQDSYSIRVAVEYPDSYPSSDHHKVSVAFLGALLSDTFEFEWSYRESCSAPWQAFNHTLRVQDEIETRLPAARISSKRFQGDSLEFVRVVIREGQDHARAALAEVEVLIYDDKVERPMPSQGRCIEKKPVGSRVPLTVVSSSSNNVISSITGSNLAKLAGAARCSNRQPT